MAYRLPGSSGKPKLVARVLRLSNYLVDNKIYSILVSLLYEHLSGLEKRRRQEMRNSSAARLADADSRGDCLNLYAVLSSGEPPAAHPVPARSLEFLKARENP